MSPGGGTPSPAVSRPDDPPSSATVTMAVISEAYDSTASRAAASPCPPPIATTRGPVGSSPSSCSSSAVSRSETLNSAGCIAMADHGVDPLGLQPCSERLDECNRAVVSAGAPDGDGEIRLALGLEAGDEELEHVFDLFEEGVGLLEPKHVSSHRLVGAPERAQLGHPVRVGEEPHVEHEVGVPGDAVLEAERGDRYSHRPLGGPFGEPVVDPVSYTHLTLPTILR